MNSFFQKLTLIFSLAMTVGLVSCQENNLVFPDRLEKSINPDMSNSNGGNGFLKKYTLTTHGKAELSYSTDGQLKNIVHNPGVSTSHTTYGSGYSYFLNSVVKIMGTSSYGRVYDTERLLQQTIYSLDSTTGRCMNTYRESYSYPGVNYAPIAHTEEWNHEYDAQGYIKKSTNDSPGSWSGYTNGNGAYFTYLFDAAGDMTKITEIDEHGKLKSKLILEYNQNIIDKNPLNRGWAAPGEPYLKIFGKPSKHILKRIVKKTFPGN